MYRKITVLAVKKGVYYENQKRKFSLRKTCKFLQVENDKKHYPFYFNRVFFFNNVFA